MGSLHQRAQSIKNVVFIRLSKFFGEFDPGSELTLVACLSHASRTRKLSSESEYSGERESNAWEIYPFVGDNISNEMLIPHKTSRPHGFEMKGGLYL